jgi:chromosome segregation ATPase
VEDNEAVLIKSKETAINETITEIKTRCVHLTKANDTYEKLVQENEDIIKTLQDEVASFKLRCFKLNMDNEKLNYAMKLKSENVNNLTTQLTSLNDENNKLQNKFDNLTNENKNLLDSLQHRIDQISQLKDDLENVKIVCIIFLVILVLEWLN